MSLGFGGVERLVLSDEKSALYLYKCENLNKPNNNPLEDGEIYIELEPIFSTYVPNAPNATLKAYQSIFRRTSISMSCSLKGLSR